MRPYTRRLPKLTDCRLGRCRGREHQAPHQRAPAEFHDSTNNVGMHHVTLCDGTPQFAENNAPSNPYPCTAEPTDDCYDTVYP